jgi:hypothetical protein
MKKAAKKKKTIHPTNQETYQTHSQPATNYNPLALKSKKDQHSTHKGSRLDKTTKQLTRTTTTHLLKINSMK